MKIRKVTFRRPPKLTRKRTIKVPIKKEKLKKGIFIIPALFTCGNMSLGILSIMFSIEGDFVKAAWVLLGALACDILDGRIARMTKTTSVFGMELDSLSDLVSFGIAPAIMIYILTLKDMGTIGIAIAILYVLCCALRLARFNALSQSGEIYKHFVGLPTPASAGVIISFVLSSQYSFNSQTIIVLMAHLLEIMPIIIVVLAFLMVSNIPYLSFKRIEMTRIRTIELFVVLIVLIILIVVYPQNTIFIIFSVYAASGLLFYIPKMILKRRAGKTAEKAEENDM